MVASVSQAMQAKPALRTTTMVDIFDVVEVNGESCLGDSTLPAMLERNSRVAWGLGAVGPHADPLGAEHGIEELNPRPSRCQAILLQRVADDADGRATSTRARSCSRSDGPTRRRSRNPAVLSAARRSTRPRSWSDPRPRPCAGAAAVDLDVAEGLARA